MRLYQVDSGLLGSRDAFASIICLLMCEITSSGLTVHFNPRQFKLMPKRKAECILIPCEQLKSKEGLIDLANQKFHKTKILFYIWMESRGLRLSI
jgi:hypothetical protein